MLIFLDFILQKSIISEEKGENGTNYMNSWPVITPKKYR